jgi:para-aminobenzoate synthetase/4-amino-4-deoxychorismate lyase
LGTGGVNVEFESEPAPFAFDGRRGPAVTLVPSLIAGGLGPHKFRDRSILERRRAELGLDASRHLLIIDSDDTVLETERANVVALVDGALVSPPPDGRLLAGVTVSLLFAVATRLGIPAAFRPVTLDDLEQADEVVCTSALRGLTPAGLIGPTPSRSPVVDRLGTVLFEGWRSS